MTLAPDALRSRLREALALPEHGSAPEVRVVDEARRDDGHSSTIAIDGKPATLLLPDGAGPHPAILYCHAHGGRYDLGRAELWRGAPWLSAPYGRDLVAAGFAVLAMDMPGFGERESLGTEAALAKEGLWRGQPLAGRMIADLLSAFDHLAARPEVDQARIATLGMSMGGSHAMWVAALEPRVAACAQHCILADIAPLIARGGHARHGDYFTVPGMLRFAEMGDVAGLIAPRPQFVAHGATDHLTPVEARDPALDRLRRAYAGTPALTCYQAPGTGHVETPKMRRAAMNFLTRVLAPKTKELLQT